MDWLLVPVAYLVGSLQWGLYVVQLASRVDVRTVGSGKTGATNVLRAAGKRAAAVVFLADAGKGLAIALLVRWESDDPALHAAVAGAVIVGHIWPVLARFRGGRGIATGVGAIAGVDPWTAAVALGVFVPVAAATRYVSLGSLLAVTAAVVAFVVRWAVFDAPFAYVWFALGAGGLIVGMHRDNVRRLLRGEERRMGDPANGA